MPLYVGDYLADTMHLSTEEHGAYLLLIFHYWQCRGLPTADEQLARIARVSLAKWKKIRPVIAEFFDEGWKHPRIEEELAKTADFSQKQSARAKAGWEKRRCRGDAAASPAQSQPQSQSQSDTQVPTVISDSEPSGESYAGGWEGKVVRLNAADYAAWAKAYSYLDLRAELLARDEWLAGQDAETRKRWFLSTSRYLANRNMDAKAKAENGGRSPPPRTRTEVAFDEIEREIREIANDECGGFGGHRVRNEGGADARRQLPQPGARSQDIRQADDRGLHRAPQMAVAEDGAPGGRVRGRREVSIGRGAE
jgi:uncharacterized protein YdaU (DUF1376 family)